MMGRKSFFFLFLLLPFLSLSSPLLEITPNFKPYFKELLKRYPDVHFHLVIYPKAKKPFFLLNNKPLNTSTPKVIFEQLERGIPQALKAQKEEKVSVLWMKVEQDKDLLRFTPCNHTSQEYSCKWKVYVVSDSAVLLQSAQGKVDLPPNACSRPLTIKFDKINKKQNLTFIVALFDSKGNYMSSKCDKDKEVGK